MSKKKPENEYWVKLPESTLRNIGRDRFNNRRIYRLIGSWLIAFGLCILLSWVLYQAGVDRDLRVNIVGWLLVLMMTAVTIPYIVHMNRASRLYLQDVKLNQPGINSSTEAQHD